MSSPTTITTVILARRRISIITTPCASDHTGPFITTPGMTSTVLRTGAITTIIGIPSGTDLRGTGTVPTTITPTTAGPITAEVDGADIITRAAPR
jgi:hypothetical protein